jgi:Phage integrase family.
VSSPLLSISRPLNNSTLAQSESRLPGEGGETTPEERTKTKHHRVVLLNERALNAITQAQRMATLRRMASKSAHPVSPFVLQPSKGGLWINEPGVTIRHFKSALKALNIRERRQYDTRRTCATLCLKPGMNPAFITNQLGHCVEMLRSTYAKWISSSLV